MTRVLAAIDNSLAAKPVLAAARAIADLLGAEVESVHVRVNGETTARSAAESVGVPLRLLVGETVDALLRAGEETDVAALVVGARALPASPRPLGSTATAVATTLSKPVVVVPPEAEEATVRRILVPLEGSRSTSEAPRSLIEAALERDLEVVVLHVIGVDSIPAFTDQAEHDLAAWTEEFLARYCPAGAGAVSSKRGSAARRRSYRSPRLGRTRIWWPSGGRRISPPDTPRWCARRSSSRACR